MSLLGIPALSTALMCAALLCVFAMWWPVLKKLELAALAARSARPSIEISFEPLAADTASVPICPYAAEPPTMTNALPALRRWRERVLGLAPRVKRAVVAKAAPASAPPKKKIKTVPPPRAPRPAPPRKLKGVPTDDAPTAMWIVAPELDFVVQRPQW
jgi:hypothetical protein